MSIIEQPSIAQPVSLSPEVPVLKYSTHTTKILNDPTKFQRQTDSTIKNSIAFSSFPTTHGTARPTTWHIHTYNI